MGEYGTTYGAERFFENILSEQVIMAIGWSVIIIALAVLALALLSYILKSVAYTTICRRRGIKAGWLAWLPILRYYVYGKVANDYDKRQNGVNRKWHIVLLFIAILSFALSVTSIVNTVDFEKEAFEMIEKATEFSMVVTVEDTLQMVWGYLLNALLISVVSMTLSTILTFLYYVCLYKAFESTAPKGALFCFIISLIIPMAEAICLFVCRNKGYELPTPATAPIPEMMPVAEAPVAEAPVAEAPVAEAPVAEETVVEEIADTQETAPNETEEKE